MKKQLFFLFLCCFLTLGMQAQTVTWTGATDMNYGNVNNWSPAQVPTAANDVIIPTGSTMNINVSASVKSIVVQGTSTVTISNALQFTDASSFSANTTVNWNNGTIRGGGTLTNNGIVNLTTSSSKYIYDNTIINNFGVINFIGTGALYINEGTFNNQLSGIIDIQSAGGVISYTSGSSHKLNNYGILKRSTTIGVASIGVELHNDGGTIAVQMGELTLNHALVKLTGGVYNVSIDASLNWSGTVTCEGILTGNLSGQINWSGIVSVPDAATFNFTGNTGVNWTNGSLRNGGVLTNTSKITMLGTSSKYIYDNTTLTNNGVLNFESTGQLYVNDGTLNNQESGIIDLKSDGVNITHTSGTTHVLNNYGVIKRSVGSETSGIGIVLNNNNGIIAVENGILNFYSLTKNLNAGTYNVADGSSLLWNTQIVCAQTLVGELNGEISWNNEVNVPEDTSAAFNFTGSTGVNWNNGNLSGGGNLINNSEITLLTTFSKYILDDTMLINNGTVNLESSGTLYINNGVFNNEATGIIEFKADGVSQISYASGSQHILNNEGLIKSSAPSSSSNIFVELHNNDGIISVESGTLNFGTLSKFLNDGVYDVSSGAALNWGVQTVLSGNLTGVLNGELIWNSEVNVPVGTTANFDFTGATGVSWKNGSLQGEGTLVNKSEITMLTSSSKYINDNTILNNQGLINYESSGTLYINNGTINNQMNGIIDFKVDGITMSHTSGSNHVLNNYGLLKRTSATGTSTLNVTLNNIDGTISVNSGTLNFNSLTKNLTNGTYNVSSGSTLDWNTQIVCEGTLEGVLDGEILWNNEVNVQPSTTAIFDFTGNSGVSWNKGSLRGGGTLTNNSKISLLATFSKYVYDNSTLNNNGSISYESTGSLYLNDGIINNLTSGIIDLKSDGTFLSHTSGSNHVFNNAGLLIKTVGTGSNGFYPTTTNSGTIDVQTGTMNFASTQSFINTVEGVIKGIGTITLPAAAKHTNDGTFAPGGSPGILTVLGTYKSTPSSVLEVEINGLTPGTEYDQLAITGTNAIFEGIVNIDLGFDANVGDSFTIATVSGTIATKNLVSPVFSVGGCREYTFSITYPNDNSVVLTVTNKGEAQPPEVNTQDITVQLDVNGEVSITPDQIDNGSAAGCTEVGNLTFSLDKTDFTCVDIGNNTVILTVTDEDGNAASETAVVTVEDILPPVIAAQDITVALDANGSATILADDIDNDTIDNCSIASLNIDLDTFDCSNIGENTVVFTAEDQNGNISTMSVIVTVTDPLGACDEETLINDDCEGAIALSCGDAVTGSTINATLSNIGNPSCAGGTPADVFYSLDVQEGNEYTINVIGEDYDGVLVLYSGSCGSLTEIACADNGFSAGMEESITFTAEATETVIIRTYDWSASAGSFTISVDCATTPDCTSPELTLEVQDANGEPIDDCIDADSEYYVMVTISGGSGNTSYILSDDNGTDLETNFTSTYLAGPYDAGDSVSFTVEGNDDDSCSVNSDVVNPTICESEPCDNPIISVSVLNADQESITCVDEGGTYYVWVEISEGSGNTSYTLSDNNGTEWESNFTSTYLAGPYDEGESVYFTIVGNDNEECSSTTDTVDPETCVDEPGPCDDPYNENAANSDVYISHIQMAGIGVDQGNTDYDLLYTSNSMSTDGYGVIGNPTLTIYPGLESAYTVSSGPAGNSSQYYYSVWVDINQDGCFDDNEQIIWSAGGIANGQIGVVNVPYTFSSFAPGTYQARIRNSMINHPMAEGSGDGEALDFTIYVITQEEAEMILDVESQAFTGFTYYPNPVVNQLNLRAGVLIDQVEVYNLLGQKVIQVKPNSLETILETDRLQSGVYLMNVIIDGSQKTFRIVKK